MTTKNQGNLGEAKVAFYFLQQGYEVFVALGEGNSCDLVVTKEGKTFRVSVKTTTNSKSNRSGSWLVDLRQRRDGKAGKAFSKELADLLVVYILPEDRIIVYDATTVDSKTSITIPNERRASMVI